MHRRERTVPEVQDKSALIHASEIRCRLGFIQIMGDTVSTVTSIVHYMSFIEAGFLKRIVKRPTCFSVTI